MARLTEQQLEEFATFGFVHLRAHLPPDLTKAIQDETDAALAAQFRDAPIGSQWMWTRASAVPQDLAPNLGALQEHPLLHGPAQQLRGDDVIGMGVDVQRYIGETAWHSDGFNSEPLPTSETGGWTAKFMLYLDELEEHTGCLWVFPASHLLRGAEREAFQSTLNSVDFRAVPGKAVPTSPGDVIIFNTNTYHGSTGGSLNRRVINVDYQLNPVNAEMEERLRTGHVGTAKGRDHPIVRTWPYNYSREWLANAGGSPIRQHWIDRWRELGALDGLQVAEGGPMPTELEANGRIAAMNDAHERGLEMLEQSRASL